MTSMNSPKTNTVLPLQRFYNTIPGQGKYLYQNGGLTPFSHTSVQQLAVLHFSQINKGWPCVNGQPVLINCLLTFVLWYQVLCQFYHLCNAFFRQIALLE